jgi:hypothetical protein
MLSFPAGLAIPETYLRRFVYNNRIANRLIHNDFFKLTILKKHTPAIK